METPEEGGVVLTLSTELYPEVTLGAYKGIEVPKTPVSVTKAEVDAEIQKLVDRNARIETVDRPAKKGDTVILDFEGFDNGVPFKGGKAEKYSLKLGTGSFVPGFEEALEGVTAGEEKDVDVTFPTDYTPELAGKPVVFKCKIHEVKETITPEVDDEFAKDVSEFDTLAALRKDLKAKLTKDRQDEADRAFENAAVELAASNMTRRRSAATARLTSAQCPAASWRPLHRQNPKTRCCCSTRSTSSAAITRAILRPHC